MTEPRQATAVRGDWLEEKSFLERLFLLNPGRVVGSGGETQQALNYHNRAAQPQFRVPDPGWQEGRRPHGPANQW